MGAMNRSIDDENGLSVLLIGTENKELLIVDVEAFTILRKVKLSSVPVFISSFGLYDVEYHITVVCRDGHGYHFTRDTDMVDLFTMETHSVGLIQKGRYLYTANTDGKFTQYTMKVRKFYTTSKISFHKSFIKELFWKSILSIVFSF